MTDIGEMVEKSNRRGSLEGTSEEHMGVVREVVTPDRGCRLVSLAQPYKGRKRQTPCRLDTSWREGLWKGGAEKWRKLGKK